VSVERIVKSLSNCYAILHPLDY